FAGKGRSRRAGTGLGLRAALGGERRLSVGRSRRQRHLFGLALEGSLLHLLHLLTLPLLDFLLLFGREFLHDGVAPLTVEVQGVLLVDVFLLRRGRIGTR